MDDFSGLLEQERINPTLITRAELKLKALLGTFAAGQKYLGRFRRCH
ncbi:hypothetical protein [Vibrio gazogenes]|nr:hypothetical protein [Vibrio gazogenes]USP13269.1 hypothetical protein MKS89_12745 [Vibrio gazogenes]SJN56724.1 hypothetical protein BQ6471_02179 [Vibrio gazogenes]